MNESLSQLCEHDFMKKITLSFVDLGSIRGIIFYMGDSFQNNFYNVLDKNYIIFPFPTHVFYFAPLIYFYIFLCVLWLLQKYSILC